MTAPTLSFTGRRVGAACAVAGSMLLIIGTYLHPVPDDPNDAVAARRIFRKAHLSAIRISPLDNT